jgi:hypothetical protein
MLLQSDVFRFSPIIPNASKAIITEVKVKLSLSLTVHYAIETYWGVAFS